jgi:hypothetical protein
MRFKDLTLTWITDGTGTRWVEVQPRKRRKSPRALRFENIKVGDQIMLKPKGNWDRKIPWYFVVTDLWFDPVEGQDDPVKGRMVGFMRIGTDGEPVHRKSSTTIRGLASQEYHYADIDYINHCQVRSEAVNSGSVIGITSGKQIRSRPKIAGL